jgi:hypothetical protein
MSSPGGPELFEPKGFWLSVNAELVIYGATEPNAQVTIGGRAIELRPDGSFSYRFLLPDGGYELPIVAVSMQGEARRADLEFSRRSTYQGEVSAHPPNAPLKSPEPGSV